MKKRNWWIRSLAFLAALIFFLSSLPMDAVTEQLVSEWFQLQVNVEPEEPAEEEPPAPPQEEEPAGEESLTVPAEEELTWTFGEEQSVYLSDLMDELELPLDSITTLSVRVSDPDLVSLHREIGFFFYDWRITAKAWFDQEELTISTYRSHYTIRLRNPAPIAPGETVISDQGSFTPLFPLPAGTAMTVGSYQPDEGEWNQVAQAAGEKANLVWMDIALMAEGQRVEAGAALTVNTDIALPEALPIKNLTGRTILRDVRLFHLAADGKMEELAVQAKTDEMAIQSISFTADSFSPFVIAYTVDFEYEGTMLSIPGGSGILLTELLAELGWGDAFGEITDASFSNPEVVELQQGEEGWKLISKMPFSTLESLTVVFLDGTRLILSVRDAQHVEDLALMLESAAIYEDGTLIPWPSLVRENKLYDIRLTFKENSVFQFLDTDEEMYYPIPEGLDLGDADFTHDFSMDVGDGIRLEGNTVRYDAATRRFTVQWNTKDKAAFNKLIASNSAQFSLDFLAKFDFTKDVIEFSENVTGQVIKDNSFDVDLEKTGEYNHDRGTIDYTVTVTSYGEALSKDGKPAVKVTDELFGSALTYIKSGENDGLSWSSSLEGREGHTDNGIALADESEQPENGFIVNIGHMDDGETITFTYSAKVDYDKLTGSGTYEETFNKVVAATLTTEKEKDHSFTNDLHYVELQKDHAWPINWNGNDATIQWKVTVNENPKVSLGGSSISDRIYAGDVEAMRYSGTGLHIRVYKKGETADEATGQAPTVFVGEYDVPWTDDAIEMTDFQITPGADGPDSDEVQYASWTYTIPETQALPDGTIVNSKEKLWYEITYTTDADRSLMVFDGYVGNEAQEHKTGTEMQDGFYPPGTGTMPEVNKEVEPRADQNAPKGSTEDYIYWKITFDRQKYDLTRCVIEDNNPEQWGHREPVDTAELPDGGYEYLYVEGLTDQESWEVSSATDTRTTIKFYRDQTKTKPGLLRAKEEYNGEGSNPSNTITIHLRTKNNATWINNTLTAYWPRYHTNTVTWICNAHQIEADATAIPDIRKIQKSGIQVGTILRDGITMPVFRFEIFVTGLDEDSFTEGKLTLQDVFDTSKLELIAPTELTEAKGFEYTQALKDDVGNYRIMEYWDQKLKGYGQTNWKGPIDAQTDPIEGGIQFTVQKTEIDKYKEEVNGDMQYCLRYSIPYYLVVKDAAAAQAMAKEALTSGKSDVEFNNTATWVGESPITDSTTVKASFKPAQKGISYDDHRDLATYQITLNPQGLRLNDGQMIRVEDTYRNLAVDFSTVEIKTVPESRKSEINWAYHSSKGTFWIPDETVVMITYQAQPIGDPGKNVTIRNELTMLTYDEVVEKTVTLNSESEGSAGDYNIRLFKYKDDFMNQPLGGAVFQLFEAGDGSAGDVQRNGRWYRPLTYKKAADVTAGSEDYEHTAADIREDDTFLRGNGYPSRLHHSAGDKIYFSTGSNGYSDIHLSQQRDGLALERGAQYYLYEVKTPDGYDKEDIYWSFIIDDMDFFDSAHGIYQYRDGGVLTVSNESSQDKGIVLSKAFTGDARDALNWNDVTFEIEGKDKDGKVVFQRTVTFADFVKYKLKIPTLPSGNGPYTYTITEKNADAVTAARTTRASVKRTSAGSIETDGKKNETMLVHETELANASDLKVSFTVTDDDLIAASETAFYVSFTNDYKEKPVELTLNKEWGDEAQKLTDRTLYLTLYKDGAEYPLYKEGDVYKPVEKSTADPRPEAVRIEMKDGNPGVWSVVVKDLPRYENGKPIQWTVKEVGASFTQDGVNYTVSEEDMDMQFNITRVEIDGTDEGGQPKTNLVLVERGEAAIDTTSSEKSTLTLNNELATLKKVKVEKKWYDEDGNDVTDSKTADDAVIYDLYRTTDELPKGGKGRTVYKIVPIDANSDRRTVINTSTIEACEGDEIDVRIKSNWKAPWGEKWAYNFGGLVERVEPGWVFGFPPVGLFDANTGRDISFLRGTENEIYLVPNYNDNTTKQYIQGYNTAGYWSSYPEIIIRFKLEDLNRMIGSKELKIRNYNVNNDMDNNCEVTISNHTQESENLTHEKLEQFVQEHPTTTTLYREGLTLGELAEWNSTNNYPDDYTYFAIERTPAGYEDTYSIVDEDDGTEHITIENRPVKREEGVELGKLTVKKEVSGLADGAAQDKEYKFQIKNGSKYLVKTENNSYELMSIAQMTTAGLNLQDDATFTVKGSQPFTFTGLSAGTYTIQEVGDTSVPGYTLQTTYSPAGGRVGVVLGGTKDAVIQNTYAPEETEVVFGKIWTDSSGKPIAWPEEQEIEIVVHRKAENTVDSSFSLTYTISADKVTLKDGSNLPAPEKLQNIKVQLVKDNAVSPYYANRYILSGLSAKGLMGANAGKEWVYYVTETVPADATYEGRVGTLNGTSVRVISEKTGAEAKAKETSFTETEYLINQITSKEIHFTKLWYDGVNNQALASWPRQEKAKEVDSQGNVIDPDAAPVYEDVPMTITLRRRLRYGSNQITNEDRNFSLTFSNLTSAVTILEKNTDEGKVTLSLTKNEGKDVFTVSGLSEKGTLDGHSGDWQYHIIESAINGYMTEYTLSDNTSSDGSYTNEGGTIHNTKKLGTIVVEKKTTGLPAGEEDKQFLISVINAENKYLNTNGSLIEQPTDAGATHPIQDGGKIIFNNVPSGTYSITEDADSAKIQGYTLNTSFSYSEVTIKDDDVRNVTVTNAYTPELTDFSFTKEWYKIGHETAQDWMTDAINVTLNRSFTSPRGETVAGDPIIMTIFPQDGNSGYDYTVTKTDAPAAAYEITIKDLEKWVPKDKLPEGVDAGKWTYTLQENERANYIISYYDSKNIDAESVPDHGRLVNRQMLKKTIIVSGTKVLLGKELQGSDFTFLMYPESSEAEKYTGSPYPGGFPTTGAIQKTALNDQEGNFTFDLSYNSLDYYNAKTIVTWQGEKLAYFYYVVEENRLYGDYQSGIKYDTSKFLVRVELKEDLSYEIKLFNYIDHIPDDADPNTNPLPVKTMSRR